MSSKGELNLNTLRQAFLLAMTKAIFILFFLISNLSLFSQAFNRYGNADTIKMFAINKYRLQIDSLVSQKTEIKLFPDSTEVEVNCKNYGDKIDVVSWFKGSRSFLRITFYLKMDQLILVNVKEQSPFFDDLYKFSGFYFESDTLFYSDYYFTIRPCMAIPVNKSPSKMYGYNDNFTGEKLIVYIEKLFLRIKTAANMGLTASVADGSTINDCR